jgi:predicted phage terminase large subunit-like protein
MPAATESIIEVRAALSAQRRRLASRSPRAFAKVYLARHFRLRPSRMHEELFVLLDHASTQRSRRLAIAAPRGHAKSTVVSLAHVLWSALYQREPLILLVSATREQAVQLLKNVKDEVQANELLLADFPEVCSRPGEGRTPKPWRDNNILLRNGVMIRALGSGQGLRGVRHGASRPSLIIGDDLENQEQCESPEQRAKMRDWFEKTLLKAGDGRTNVVVVGTVLHYDSLLATLVNPVRGKGSGWDSRVYRAVESFSERANLWDRWESIRVGEAEHDGRRGPEASTTFFEANKHDLLQGTRVLWPEMEDYHRLMQIRVDEGRLSFQSEKQNEPLDPEQCLFSSASFRYWDDESPDPAALLRRLGPHTRIYGACDPSLGRHVGRGDYTAIITVAKDVRDDSIYVLDADIARRKPEQTIERILALAGVYRYDDFIVESNQFQEVMVRQLEHLARARGVRLYPRAVNNTANKQARVEGLEPLISSGRLKFSRRQSTLLDQLRHFPLGAHDDGPDALELVVTRAVERRTAKFGRYMM